MNTKSATKRSKKKAASKKTKDKSVEARLAALEAAVEDLKYWRTFRDRED